MDGKLRDWRTATGVLLVALSASTFFFQTFWPALRTAAHGFPSYYVSARLVLERRWSPHVYDNAWFSDEVMAQSNDRLGETYGANTPIMSLMLVPLAWLDMDSARVVWLWLNLPLLAACIWLLMAVLVPIEAVAVRAALIALVFVYAPLRENFRLGQVYVLLLFLFALVLWSLPRGRWAPAGIALGAAAAAKLSGLPVWLTLAVRGRRRALFVGGLTGLGLMLMSLAVTGQAGWAAFLRLVPEYVLGQEWAGVVAIQTTPSFFRHLFVADAEWNPRPLWHQPWLAPACSLSISAVTLGLTLWTARRAPFDLAFAAALTLGVILFPLAEEHHYTLLLLPLAVMAVRLARRPFGVGGFTWLAASLVLLAAPWPYEHPWFYDGWHALLAYPRLYGGWLVWAWLLRQMACEIEDVHHP